MKYDTGDLWKYEADYRVVTTNGIVKRNGEAVIGAGVAKQAATRYPALPKYLGEHIQTHGNVLGVFPEYGVITFPTKDHWRSQSSLELIRTSVAALHKQFAAYTVKKEKTVVTVPPGTGLGGLSWTQVQPIMEQVCHDWDRLVMLLPDELINSADKSIKHYVRNVRSGFVDVNVYIGRSNPRVPFDMRGKNGFFGNPIVLDEDTIKGRKECIVKYWDWLISNDEKAVKVRANIHLLKGLNLGCWCSPKLCHGHILARLANDPHGYQFCLDQIEKFRKELAA